MFDKIEVHEQWMKPFYDYYLKGIDNGLSAENAGCAIVHARRQTNGSASRNGR